MVGVIDGIGEVTVYSHRIYGKDAAGPMAEWMKAMLAVSDPFVRIDGDHVTSTRTSGN